MFQSKRSTGDYQYKMNSESFVKWFCDLLLEPNSVIVMDNASYHSRKLELIPTISSRKAEIQNWLVVHGNGFSERTLKSELPRLITHSQSMS